MNAFAKIEYNISQDREEHNLTSDELADLIEDIAKAIKEDIKHDTDVFYSKYLRLIQELRRI